MSFFDLMDRGTSYEPDLGLEETLSQIQGFITWEPEKVFSALRPNAGMNFSMIASSKESLIEEPCYTTQYLIKLQELQVLFAPAVIVMLKILCFRFSLSVMSTQYPADAITAEQT